RIKEIQDQPDPFSMVLDLGEKGKREIYFEHPDIPAHNAIKEELQAFHRAISNGTKPMVSAEDGYRALETAWQINHMMNHTEAS
ncbi:MAG: gfo/Idh/MocA family oxidoreductase, partial [Flavobacteriales bacterium]|nr:gfo/Idh/MocA family oxidoreductase [Flavobacteriales bacterium]